MRAGCFTRACQMGLDRTHRSVPPCGFSRIGGRSLSQSRQFCRSSWADGGSTQNSCGPMKSIRISNSPPTSNVIGQQGSSLIVELIAYVENRGKAQHQMEEFNFDLNALLPNDPVLPDQRWDGQINFPNEISKGTFLPARYKYFFVDAGTKAKYSHRRISVPQHRNNRGC